MIFRYGNRMINADTKLLTEWKDNTSKIHYGMWVVLENALGGSRLKAKREILCNIGACDARGSETERRRRRTRDAKLSRARSSGHACVRPITVMPMIGAAYQRNGESTDPQYSCKLPPNKLCIDYEYRLTYWSYIKCCGNQIELTWNYWTGARSYWR